MKRILITGCGGFIGRSLAESLQNVYDVLTPDINELNLLDTEKVKNYLERVKADIVIHCANYGGRDGNNIQPLDTMNCGLHMFYNLKRCNDLFERMYYMGSGAEYGKKYYIPYMKEEYFGEHVPEDPYGFYKYILSQECFKNENIYDLRLFGIYGKYEAWCARFISSNICRAIKGIPLTLSKDMLFDYIYIDDFANIMRWFIENTPKHHHYNVCRGEHISLKALGEMIRDTLRADVDFLIKEDGMKPEYSGDNSRLSQELGDVVRFTPFEDTILSMGKYYRSIIDQIDESILP